jgi:arginine-tRNA-protein transferase
VRETLTTGSYDPDFGEWEFGKLSAMREIAFTLEGGYQYYYMGAVNKSKLLNNVILT